MISCRKNELGISNMLMWENFKAKLEQNDIEFLLDNSLDTIQCVNCVKNEKTEWFSSKVFFENYRSQLYHKELLDQKKYTVFKEDTIVRIMYSFNNSVLSDENSTTVYTFVKKENKFLFEGRFTIP